MKEKDENFCLFIIFFLNRKVFLQQKAYKVIFAVFFFSFGVGKGKTQTIITIGGIDNDHSFHGVIPNYN